MKSLHNLVLISLADQLSVRRIREIMVGVSRVNIHRVSCKYQTIMLLGILKKTEEIPQRLLRNH